MEEIKTSKRTELILKQDQEIEYLKGVIENYRNLVDEILRDLGELNKKYKRFKDDEL